MAFADLTARLRLNIADFSAKMTEASKQMRRFSNKMNTQYGDAAKALTAHNMGLKDTNRIVQGILVAQAFYGGARAIREATSAIWGFNEALDYAQITYSALFGSSQLASDFMSVLQEHSIETIFDYQQLAEASKKLLAYGIDYKNLMFIMEGLTNLGAMSGDAAALDRISLALGQIYTRGKLTAEEMRQLANAYVPIAEIVQERFNLTPDQMGKIGDLNLPAHEVINAVVDYANERFGDVGDAAMFTITGLKNKIVDTFKVLGVEMLAPVTRAFKSFLAYTSKGLEGVRKAFATGGMGGILDYLVPNEDTQTVIRQFLANVRNLFMSIMSIATVAGQVIKNFGYVFVTAFNMATPVITMFINVMSRALHAMMDTRAGAIILRIALLAAASAFVVVRAHALGALVITSVTKAVMGLSKALILLATLVTRHPILMLLAGLATAMVGVSLASGKANKGLSSLFDTLSGVGTGASSGDMLKDVNKELDDGTNKIDQFDDRLQGSADAAGDLADGINKAGKEAKKTGDLLSFDEVFKLRDEEKDGGGGSGSGAGVMDGIGALTDGLGGLSDALIPDIPDFSEFIDGFTDGLFGGLLDGISGNLLLAGLGALITGKVLKALEAVKITKDNAAIVRIAKMLGTALMGAFIGLGLDAIISPFTDRFWAFLEEKFKLGPVADVQASIGATIGSVVGGAIGMLVGGLPGSLIGTAIGHLAGGIAGLLWEEINGALNNTFIGLGTGILNAISKALANVGAAGIGTVIKNAFANGGFKGVWTAIGGMLKNAGLKSILKGGAIGAAIGLVTDSIAALLWDQLAEKFESADKGKAKVGQTIGSVIGIVIGTLIGGPPGALIGGAIGTFAGGLVGLFWDKILEFFTASTVAGGQWGTAIGMAIGAAFGPIGAIAGSAIGLVAGAIVGHFWDDITKGLSSWWGGVEKAWNDWWTQLGEDWTNWWDGVAKGWTNWWTETSEGFSNWCEETGTTISTWWDGVETDFTNYIDTLTTNLSDWWSETKTNWSKKYGEIKNDLSTWWDGVQTKYGTKMDTIKTKLSTWWEETKANWSKKYGEIKTNLGTWWDGVKTDYDNKMAPIKTNLSNWWEETKTNWSKKYEEIKTNLSTWWSGVQKDYDTNLSQVGGKLTTWFGNTKESIGTWFEGIKQSIKTWWSNSWLSSAWETGWSKISSWFSDTLSSIGTWFGNTKTNVKVWWDYTWNPDKWKTAWESTKEWFSTFLTDIGKWFTNIKTSIKTWWDNLWSGLKTPIVETPTVKSSTSRVGHATGGIFNREHIARFAEGNKAEAIIPLENNRAMQPFVDAVANGLTGSLAPILSNMNSNAGNSQLPPMYVGTLIADERGLKQLYKKFEIIQLQENARRGITNA